MKRFYAAIVVTGALILTSAYGEAAVLDVELFPFTGEIRFKSPGAVPVDFVFYSISSPSGSLVNLPGAWKPIADFYDASGNGFIDPIHNWSKLSNTPAQIAEGVFEGDGGRLPAMRSISLGRIWIPNRRPIPDLVFDIRDPNGEPINVSAKLRIDGDYLPNLSVNQADYDLWLQYFGATNILFADGNINGMIDAADYVLWREHLGRRFTGFGSIPGDFSGNGSVENADLTLLLDNWGAVVPPVPGGWDGYQPTAPAIDNDELTAFLDNWGATSGSAAAIAAVPEPGTYALLGFCVALLGYRKDRCTCYRVAQAL